MNNGQYEVHLNLNVRGLPVSATLGINETSNRLISEGRQVYKLGLGQSPFPVPEPVVRELQNNAHQKIIFLSVVCLRSVKLWQVIIAELRIYRFQAKMF